MFLIVGKAVDKLITVSSPLNLLLALVFQRIVSLESLRAQTSLEQSSLGSELSKENDCQTQSHLRRTGSVTCAFHQRDGVHPGGGVLVTILIVTSRPSGTNPWLTLFIWKEETVQLKDLNVLFCPTYRSTNAYQRRDTKFRSPHFDNPGASRQGGWNSLQLHRYPQVL